MYLQPGHAGCVVSTVFFNGTLIRTLSLGTGACLTPVANNCHLLAELTPRDRLLYVAILCMRRSINYIG